MAARREPRSLAELADEAAATIRFSPRYSCRAWLRSCNALTDQARHERQKGDVEGEFLSWARCASILLELLPTHPQWRDLTADDKARVRSQGHASLDQLSWLKPLISDRYEAWRSRASHGHERTASSSARQDARGSSSRSPQPPPAAPQQPPSSSRPHDQALEDQMRRLQVAPPSSTARSSYDGWQDDSSLRASSSSSSYYGSTAAPPSLPAHQPRQSYDRPSAPYGHSSPQPPPPPISYPALVDARSSSSHGGRYSPASSSLAPPSSSYNLPAQSRPQSASTSRQPSPSGAPPPQTASTTAPPSWSGLRTMNVPPSLVDAFLKRAAKNTKKRIETCGLLLGSLDGGVFTVRVLLLPVQKGTGDTCETLEEEKVFDFQDKRGLLTLGWIHTHPTQSCFMSSLDLHTHSAYQIMLPEAIAIVCAPQSSPDLGIFRLTDPPGLQLIMSCTRHETFHPHPDVKGGIYTGGFGTRDKGFGHVRMREGQGVEVVDLRK